MKTVNSLSGGKTSAYISKHYPADFNVFALVRTSDPKCLWMNGKDEKTRQLVSDKIGQEFIGTLEMDEIVYTMLDLEQFIGQEINWVTGLTFDDVIKYKGGWLPNKLHRYCTTNMKLIPIFEWWHRTQGEPVEMGIGFRANEQSRAKKMIEKLNSNGLLEIKATVSKHPSGRNKWQTFEWQKPVFPLIQDGIFKDQIENYWKDKPVRFAMMNNCVGCFHRNEILLNKLYNLYPNKIQWFSDQELGRNGKGTWRTGITYQKIISHRLQVEIEFDDFVDCDSGYCGL
jgi:hypothetical protein